jgi:hypothetical protein
MMCHFDHRLPPFVGLWLKVTARTERGGELRHDENGSWYNANAMLSVSNPTGPNWRPYTRLHAEMRKKFCLIIDVM